MDALRTNGFLGAAALALVASFTVVEPEYVLLPQLLSLMLFCAGVTQRSHRFGTVLTAAVNAGLASYLYEMKVDNALGKSACDIDTLFTCGAVNNSGWSELMGIPITLLGMGVYAGLALGALMAGRDDARFDRVNAAVGIFNLGFSLLLGMQMVQIGTVCLFCLSMYAGHAILLWAGLRGLEALDTTLTDDLAPSLTSHFGLIVAGFAALAAVYGLRVYKPATALPSIDNIADKPNEPTVTEQLSTLYAKPGGEVNLNGNEPILGDPNAPIMVVEFADFGCPHCAMAGKELHELVEAYPDVQVRFKYFPLSGPCNPDFEPGDVSRCNAAFAAECARKQNKFWQMSDQLFTNQGYFEADQLAFMAKEIGLDVDAWKACLDKPEVLANVADNAKAGVKAGVMGTPAMYVKGIAGDGFVEMTRGVQGIALLADAKKAGADLPAP